MSSSPILIYRLNRNFEIVYANEEWEAFASEAGVTLNRADILSRRLWDFCEGHEVIHFLHALFKRIQEGKKPVTLPFRCDGPDVRRYMEFLAVPLPERMIEIRTKVLRLEPRAFLLKSSKKIESILPPVSMCAWCNRVQSAGRWMELEDAIKTLQVFEQVAMPTLTHGICPECSRMVEEEAFPSFS